MASDTPIGTGGFRTLGNHLSSQLQRLRRIWQAPPPEPSVFLERVRFVERNVGLPVKAALMPVLAYVIYFAMKMDDMTLLQQEAFSLLRNYFVIYVAASIGAGIFFWGMNDVPPRVVERAVYVMALLDAALRERCRQGRFGVPFTELQHAAEHREQTALPVAAAREPSSGRPPTKTIRVAARPRLVLP